VNAGWLFSLKYHLVWCLNYPKQILMEGPAKRLRELLYNKAKESKAEIRALEMMADHFGLFVESDPTRAPGRLAAQSKSFASLQLRQEFPWRKSFLPSLWSEPKQMNPDRSVFRMRILIRYDMVKDSEV
jgi:putative transposase